MQINVKVNEKDVLEETYTITLSRDEIEQVEQALLEQRMNLMTLIQSARGEEALDLIDEHEDLRQLEKLIDRIQISHLFMHGGETLDRIPIPQRSSHTTTNFST